MAEDKTVTWLTISGLSVSMTICLWLIATGSNTPKETTLLSLFLTILSIILSWILARHYSEHAFNKNLKVFALKAAEKVTNLSNEMDRLVAFLRQWVDSEEQEDTLGANQGRQARLDAVVHIIGTLKSVNDGSLSDWQGVIGEELNAKKEERQEREEELKELVARLEALSEAPNAFGTTADPDATVAILRPELEALNSDIRALATQVSGLPLRTHRVPKPGRQAVRLPCPTCDTKVDYTQRPVQGGRSGVKCKNCEAKLYSEFNGGTFHLRPRRPEPQSVTCIACEAGIVVEVDPLPGSANEAQCTQCGTKLWAYRTPDGVFIKDHNDTKVAHGNRLIDPEAEVTEDQLNEVRSALPSQPWPKGTAKEIAVRLGMPSSVVYRAIQELIRRGEFKLQMDGKLYVPEEVAKSIQLN